VSKTHRVTCIIGTRPEVLKMAPVILALEAQENIQVDTIVTGQHREMLDQMLTHFNINVTADFNIMTENQQLSQLTARLLELLADYLKTCPSDLIIAQGDTTTTMTAALSAFYHHIPFMHVEAGLRTDNVNMPFPEELNRRITSQIASIHCCPTELAKENLLKEGIAEHVHMTGNTIIDTLYRFTKGITIPKNDKKIILVTCHRRENFGKPMENICTALKEIIQHHLDVEIVLPVHPNPNVKQIIYHHLQNVDRIHLTEHLDYEALTTLLAKSYLVITDSGGLQEEAPALGKPVLVLREQTERPEGIACGAAKIVGTDPKKITEAVNILLTDPKAYQQMSTAGSPYGDGNASERIAKIVTDYLITVQ